MQNTNNAEISPLQAILVLMAFIVVTSLVAIGQKLYYRFVKKKRFYIFPHLSIKGITNVAMVIAISVAIIILLTVLTADVMAVVFRAWPGTRMMLEGVLIKIGGLLFGPFIGMFIGGMTDLLSVAMTAGVFHYGYLIGAVGYGLFGGIIRMLFNWSKAKAWLFTVYSTIISSVIGLVICLFLKYLVSGTEFGVTFMGVTLQISKDIMIGIIAAFILLSILVLWIAYFVHQYRINVKKYPDKGWFNAFAPVLITSIVSEAVINVLMMPSFDAQLSSLTYSAWISIRTILFIPMVALNIAIIYPIFKIVTPLIRYNYQDDLVENFSRKIYID